MSGPYPYLRDYARRHTERVTAREASACLAELDALRLDRTRLAAAVEGMRVTKGFDEKWLAGFNAALGAVLALIKGEK